jgi:hypothetical protein
VKTFPWFSTTIVKDNRHKITPFAKLQVKVEVKLSPYLTKHYAMKMYGEWLVGPCFPDLNSNWKCVVSFTPRPFYPLEKEPPPLNRRLHGPPRASLDYMEKRKFLTLLGIEL